jgi:hypothetical protein
MRIGAARAGVCIVRVELQEGRLLITVTTNRALNRDLRSATADSIHRYNDPDRALEAVREFLGSYENT